MRDVDYILDDEDLRNLLKENTLIYLVTDGGVKDNIGYYRWVIATVMEIVHMPQDHLNNWNPCKQRVLACYQYCAF